MKKWVWLALLAALPLAVMQAEEKDAAVTEAAQIKELAAQLTAGRADRAAKIAAVHLFVRDEIAQAKTQYG